MQSRAPVSVHGRDLVAWLRDPAAHDHAFEGPVELLETRVPWVFLVGERVPEVKKPVDLGFLDFTMLVLRRQACR